MKIPPYRGLTLNDLGQIPDWAQRILDTLQAQIEIVSLAMNSNLTLSDNFRGERQDVALTHGQEATLSVNQRPVAVLPVWASSGAGVSGFSWRLIEDTKVAVTVWYTRPTDAQTATVRLIFLGD